jgi:hypothetical protein
MNFPSVGLIRGIFFFYLSDAHCVLCICLYLKALGAWQFCNVFSLIRVTGLAPFTGDGAIDLVFNIYTPYLQPGYQPILHLILSKRYSLTSTFFVYKIKNKCSFSTAREPKTELAILLCK